MRRRAAVNKARSEVVRAERACRLKLVVNLLLKRRFGRSCETRPRRPSREKKLLGNFELA